MAITATDYSRLDEAGRDIDQRQLDPIPRCSPKALSEHRDSHWDQVPDVDLQKAGSEPKFHPDCVARRYERHQRGGAIFES
jgi:hypothetical protein